jgi:hypothetical protein
VGAALTARVGWPVGSTGPSLDMAGQVVRLVRAVMSDGAALGWSGVPTKEQALADSP